MTLNSTGPRGNSYNPRDPHFTPFRSTTNNVRVEDHMVTSSFRKKLLQIRTNTCHQQFQQMFLTSFAGGAEKNFQYLLRLFGENCLRHVLVCYKNLEKKKKKKKKNYESRSELFKS